MNSNQTYDVVVVGAGSAGLQAALTLGRMRRRVAVFSTDRFRNDPTDAMHNFLGHDGAAPAELRLAARKDIDAYDTVEIVERAVVSIRGELGHFTVEVDGAPAVTARRVLLATGVSDQLPDIPGLEELFGDVVAHCPFCHGYEYADTPVGILGAAPHVPVMAALIGPIASRVVVLTNGDALEPATAASLAGLGAEVHTGAVAGTCRGSLGVRVDFADGHRIELGGLLVKTDWSLSAPFAEQLGLDRSEVGAIVVDAMGRTSLPGVYAAGDIAQGPGMPMPMASVLTAASAGLVAAAACVQDESIARAESGL